MKLALGALVALGGCDSLFDIHRIDITTGSNTPDAPAIYLDAPADSGPCGMHDEDGDGAFDKCDSCPTISNAGDSDSDGDGVGDMCDPDLGPHNTIDAFYSFQNGLGVNGTGDSYPNDTLRLASGGEVVTVKSFMAPEVIAVMVTTLNAGNAVEIIANAGGVPTVTCELSAACTSTPTCLLLSASTGELGKADLSEQVAEISTLRLYRNVDGTVRCSVNDLRAENTAILLGVSLPSGKLELSSIGGAATFANAIVYTSP